jgi:hypothetical protein
MFSAETEIHKIDTWWWWCDEDRGAPLAADRSPRSGSMVESGDMRSISPNPDDDEQQEEEEEDGDGDRICSMADEPRIGRKSGLESSGWKKSRSTESSIKPPGSIVSMAAGDCVFPDPGNRAEKMPVNAFRTLLGKKV